MSPYQIVAVAVIVAISAIDGYDVLSVTFAAPGISSEWHLGQASLGVVLSTGLIGMAVGSLLLAPLADVLGRRRLVLMCLAILSGSMLASALAHDLLYLTMWRFVTGLAIGSMIAVINPLAAEYSNARRRELTIAIMTVGYPAGGMIGGAIAAMLLASFGWRSVFFLGAAFSGALWPIAYFLLPESLAFLIEKAGPQSLCQANRFLTRCGHAEVDHLPSRSTESSMGLRDLMRSSYARAAIRLTCAYFAYVLTCYFVLSWLPKLMSLRGYSASAAVQASTLLNLGGVLGGISMGWLAPRWHLKLATMVAMGLFSTAICALAFGPSDLFLSYLLAAVTGFFLFAASVGFYSIMSRSFPAAIRATGTGLVLGIGRVGSAVGPVLAGLLLSVIAEPRQVMALMAAGPLVGLCILATLPSWRTRLPHSSSRADRNAPEDCADLTGEGRRIA